MTTKVQNKQPYTYAEARLKAVDALPYLTQHIMSLTCVPTPGLGTFAVDKYMRLYYDPECLEKWTLEECAGVILHEDVHVVLGHCKRAERTIGNTPTKWQAEVWNYAVDIVTNQMLRECKNKSGGPAVKLPAKVLYPETFNLPANLTAEEYYHKLMEQLPKPEWGDDPYGSVRVWVARDGQGGDGEGQRGNGRPGPGDIVIYDGDKPQPGCGSGGSGGDGLPKPWEQGPPDGEHPGRTEFEQDLLARKVAQAIEQHQKARGNIPGCWARYAQNMLKPKHDPCRELEAVVKHSIDATYGFGNHTWRKLNRRIPAGCGPLPAHIKPIPRVTVLVDTSGSMDQNDLAMAMGIIGEVLKGLPTREGLRVVAGDTHVQASRKVFRTDAVELAGGGGTMMDVLIEECAKQVPKPDVILLVSDGYTNYPQEPVGPKVVACITREHNNYPVPEWITKVVMKVDDAGDA